MKLETTIQQLGFHLPTRLTAFQMWLTGSQWTLVDPCEVDSVFPLLLPVARDEQADAWIGFLCWPGAEPDFPLPVVRQEGYRWTLLARSIDEVLHRELVTREYRGEPFQALLQAANRPAVLYQPGEVARSGLPLNAYLLTQAGVNWTFFEELSELHCERGDTIAALITADRACRQTQGWGRPFATRARLLAQMEKHEEAAESARLALIEPLWTLGEPFEPTARLAGWRDPIDSSGFWRLANDPSRPALDRAAHLLDAATIDQRPWPSIRMELSNYYRQAGHIRFADWIYPA